MNTRPNQGKRIDNAGLGGTAKAGEAAVVAGSIVYFSNRGSVKKIAGLAEDSVQRVVLSRRATATTLAMTKSAALASSVFILAGSPLLARNALKLIEEVVHVIFRLALAHQFPSRCCLTRLYVHLAPGGADSAG